MMQNKEQELTHIQLMIKHGYEALESYDDFKRQKIVIDEDRAAKLISLDLAQVGEQCGYVEKRDDFGEKIRVPKISNEIKKKYHLIPWKKMYRLRNLISHSYHSVRKAVIFEVCKDYLPKELPILEIIEDELISNIAVEKDISGKEAFREYKFFSRSKENLSSQLKYKVNNIVEKEVVHTFETINEWWEYVQKTNH